MRASLTSVCIGLGSILSLAACGADVAASAAAGAVAKQQEIEQAQATQTALEEQLNKTMQEAQERQKALEQEATR